MKSLWKRASVKRMVATAEAPAPTATDAAVYRVPACHIARRSACRSRRLVTEEVVLRLPAADHAHGSVADEHDRGPRHAVVRRAHRERVGARRRDREQVAATWMRELGRLDQDVAGLAVLAGDAVDAVGELVRAVGEQRVVACAV